MTIGRIKALEDALLWVKDNPLAHPDNRMAVVTAALAASQPDRLAAVDAGNKFEQQLKKAETLRKILINRAIAHKTASTYAAEFFDIKDARVMNYLRNPYEAPGEVLNIMCDNGLSNPYRTPTRRGIETVWPVYYAKFATEVLILNGLDADVSPWDESEMNKVVATFKPDETELEHNYEDEIELP